MNFTLRHKIMLGVLGATVLLFSTVFVILAYPMRFWPEPKLKKRKRRRKG